jgi:hypothetical protein
MSRRKSALAISAAIFVLLLIAMLLRPKPTPAFTWTFLGFTNQTGSTYALVELKNVGGHAVEWGRGSYEFSVFTDSGTNRDAFPKLGWIGWMMKGESEVLMVQMFDGAQSWSVVFHYKLRSNMELAVWLNRLGIPFRAGEGVDGESSSPVFTNTPPR